MSSVLSPSSPFEGSPFRPFELRSPQHKLQSPLRVFEKAMTEPEELQLAIPKALKSPSVKISPSRKKVSRYRSPAIKQSPLGEDIDNPLIEKNITEKTFINEFGNPHGSFLSMIKQNQTPTRNPSTKSPIREKELNKSPRREIPTIIANSPIREDEDNYDREVRLMARRQREGTDSDAFLSELEIGRKSLVSRSIDEKVQQLTEKLENLRVKTEEEIKISQKQEEQRQHSEVETLAKKQRELREKNSK